MMLLVPRLSALLAQVGSGRIQNGWGYVMRRLRHRVDGARALRAVPVASPSRQARERFQE